MKIKLFLAALVCWFLVGCNSKVAVKSQRLNDKLTSGTLASAWSFS
jgi:hypothetical protein